MSEWRDAALSSLAEGGPGGISGGPFGSALGRKHYTPSGVPVIRGAQVASDSPFTHKDLVFVSQEKADRHRRNLAAPGDVIVTQRGTLGQVGIVPVDSGYERYLLSQSQMKITVDQEVAVPKFIYYALRSPETVSRLEGHALIAGVPHINLGILRDLEIRMPSRRTQKRIAQMLAAFDNLIEINQRRIELLEELARSLYREWFVRFRFPGHEEVDLIDSTMGPIPEGWSFGSLSDVADVVVEGVQPSDLERTSRYVGLEHLPRRHTTLREWGSAGSVSSRKLLFSRGDTLFGKIRPYFHKVVWAPFDAAASSDTIVLRAHPDLGLSAFVNAVASSDALVAQAVATSNGTKMPRADPKALLAYKLPLPDQALLVEFERIVRPWLECGAQLVHQNRQLARTRDLLLPRLVTGRLDVSDVDLGDLLADEAAE